MSKITNIEFIKGIKKLGGYGVSHFITILQPLLITPLLTRSLTVSEYGVYSLYFVIFGFLVPIISFNFSTFILKEFYNELKNKLSHYLKNLILISLILLVFVLLITYLIRDKLVFFLELPSINIIYYAILSSFFFSIINLTKSVLRARGDLKYFVLLNVIVVLSVVLIIGLFFTNNFLTLDKAILSFVVVYAVASICALKFLLKIELDIRSILVLNKKTTYRVIKFCFPLVLYSLTAILFTMADRLIINHFISKEGLAIYSATFQLALGVTAFGTVLQLAWSPYVFKHMSGSIQIKKKVKLYGFCALALIVIYSLFYFLIYPWIFEWYFPASYNKGLDFFHWFILAGMIQSVYWLVNPFLLILEKNYYFFYITLISAIVSISVNITFIEKGIDFLAMVYFFSWSLQLMLLLITVLIWYSIKIKTNE